MTAPMPAKQRIQALGWILLCALLAMLAGCTPAAPPELEREMTEQSATLPALPDSQEIGRRFLLILALQPLAELCPVGG